MTNVEKTFRALLAVRGGTASAREWSDLRRTCLVYAAWDDDVAQDALLRILRFGNAFSGNTPGEACAWLRTVVRGAQIDSLRSRLKHHPVVPGVVITDTDVHAAEDEAWRGRWVIPVAEAPRDAVCLRTLFSTVLDHVAEGLPERRAVASWARVVHGIDIGAIAEATSAPSAEAAMKWVERGRDDVLRAVDSAPIDSDVRALLRALFTARRSDFGLARPSRRKAAA